MKLHFLVISRKENERTHLRRASECFHPHRVDLSFPTVLTTGQTENFVLFDQHHVKFVRCRLYWEFCFHSENDRTMTIYR